MALPSTIYRVNISLSDVDRGIYEALQTTVALHPSETGERLAARLLAYALFYDSALTFTKGVGAGEEPDLWMKGPDGRTLLWIEVGLPESERLIKAGRHSYRVALIAFGKALAFWELQHLPKLTGIDNLQIVTFDPGFIGSLAATLERSINWSITMSDNHLYINSGAETFQTILHSRG
jgi:uncharacterized protein YaeQ